MVSDHTDLVHNTQRINRVLHEEFTGLISIGNSVSLKNSLGQIFELYANMSALLRWVTSLRLHCLLAHVRSAGFSY